jgi:glucose-1-phosphatase
MAKSGIHAIIFDIGRVLIRVDVQRAQKGLANGSPLTPEELWSAIEKDPHWRDWQEGRLSARDWHQNLSKRFGMTLSFDEFTKVWNSALDPQPIHPDYLFSRLSKSYRLGLLSNTDPIHVAHMENSYNFFRYFPKQVRTYSCAVGASKPEPLIFREALRSSKVGAEQAVYIDDIPAFAEAARALGLHAIHYRSPEQLQSDFQALGIIAEGLPTA